MNFVKPFFHLFLGRRLPIINGTLKVSGIHQPVLIRRDRYGITYIEAESDLDGWYGLGFCHGQDRAFQLEGLLRIVRGTLAELVGRVALPIDRLSRRIGFAHSSEIQLSALNDDVYQTLQAYAQGVTEGAKSGCRKQAHEFLLLRTQGTAYRASDALGMLKLLSFTLASNWDCELERLKILMEDGPEALISLDPTYPEWLPVTSQPTACAGSAVNRLAEDLTVFTSTVGWGGGSNNWAVAPARTATGRAILANDPHLAPILPPHWYLAHVRTPDWTVAGASFVGAPCFPAGHNEKCAWGITAGLIDNTDLFLEEISSDGCSVREDTHFVPCETRHEIIQVKGEEPIEEEVLITRHGPIIGPALDGEVGAVSLKATWLEPKPVSGLLQIHRARSFEDFRNAFREWPGCSLNMVYADTSGTVGWQLVGEAPRRRRGWGTIPLPGWDPEVRWEENPVPFDKMPYLVNPKEGFVATANSRPTRESNCPFLGTDWVDGYRLARIVERLEAQHDWDVNKIQALQMDQQSIPWRELRDIIMKVPVVSDKAQKALKILAQWDGKVTIESTAASVFEFFVAQMVRRIVEAKAPRTVEQALGKGFSPLVPFCLFSVRRVGHLVRIMRERPAGWFEHTWDQEINAALESAINTLQKKYGADPDRWAWGHIRPLTLCHPMGERRPLNWVFNRGPFDWGGDPNTVSQGAVNPMDPAGNPFFIASLRMVIDVGNWDESRFALPGGQSGNPLSPHYDDQLPFWIRGEGIPIAWSPTLVDQATRNALKLTPK
ncbi:MAG: penicillin acylase family protein [Sedimentisphaerales bacterium]|nr:penicillin acylase family protein [Sedimentisphaerales bacterium]